MLDSNSESGHYETVGYSHEFCDAPISSAVWLPSGHLSVAFDTGATITYGLTSEEKAGSVGNGLERVLQPTYLSPADTSNLSWKQKPLRHRIVRSAHGVLMATINTVHGAKFNDMKVLPSIFGTTSLFFVDIWFDPVTNSIITHLFSV